MLKKKKIQGILNKVKLNRISTSDNEFKLI